MSAGACIVYSEYNGSKTPLIFFIIKIETNKNNVKSRLGSKSFPKNFTPDLTLFVSDYQEC